VARVLMIAYTTYVHDARVKRHARALADRGDRVDLLCLQNEQEGQRNGVNVIGLNLRRYRGGSRAHYIRTYLRFFAAATRRAWELSLKRPYDVTIVCTMPDLAILCGLPARFLGSRLVLDVHDTMPELYREKFSGRFGQFGAKLLRLEERLSAALADRVLAVHEPHKRRLAGAGVRANKISVVLNVPDPAIFGGAPPSPRGAAEEFVIVCHGTMAPRLSLDVAVEAMDRLRTGVPQARLLLIGAGEYLEQIKADVHRRGLQQSVRFADPVSLEELPGLLREADVGLVPNRASGATHLMLPVKLMEYVALGIPVIASRLRTIEYYFTDDAVRFFTPGDAGGLAAAIEELWRDEECRRRLAERARQELQAIGWPEQRDNLYRAVDATLSAARGRGPVSFAAPWFSGREQAERRVEVD
jgi:glycosyltransferase involved in cell wall biosynthesis